MNGTKRHKQFLTLWLTLLIGFAGAAGYCIVSCDTEIDFRINWNMFNSVLMWPLFIIGFVGGLGIKSQEYIPMIRKEDRYGNVTHERDYDIINNVETGCLMPLLSYLVLYPLMIAAAIYYLLMGAIYLFGAIFPWLIAVYLIVSLVFFYKWERRLMARRAGVWKMCAVMWLFTVAIWLMYILWIPFGEASSRWMNPAALGIMLATAAVWITDAIRQRSAAHSGETDSPPDVAGTQPGISKRFVIAYLIAFLFIFGIYFFKSSNPSHTSSEVETASARADIYYVTADKLNVRNRPDANATVIGQLRQNQECRVYSYDAATRFATIQFDGVTAYVSADYLKPKDTSSRNSLIPAPSDASSGDSPSASLTDEQIRMSGWKAHGLLGRVKSVTYSTGEKLEFNADGNLISGGRTYQSASRYIWEKERYDILFPDRNTRYEKWHSGTFEDIGIYYRFDGQGRIAGRENTLDYSIDMIKYVYAGSGDKLPATVIYTAGDESGSSHTTYTYVYVDTDDRGNWTKRNVTKKVEVEEFEANEVKTVETSSFVETAEYVYF
jgi:uncharacterized protein YgiM (DUF1202 family)